jgi:hypothetical protein
MSSPLPLFFILATYVSFIFKIGPAVMKNRQPVNLDKAMMVYNWAQIILNATIFIMGLGQIPRMSLFCSPLDQSNDPHVVTMVNLHYYYMMLKILDLLDTVSPLKNPPNGANPQFRSSSSSGRKTTKSRFYTCTTTS